jgi:hypothetical protein
MSILEALLVNIDYYHEISLDIKYNDNSINIVYNANSTNPITKYLLSWCLMPRTLIEIQHTNSNYLTPKLHNILNECNDTISDFITIYDKLKDDTIYECNFKLFGPLFNVFVVDGNIEYLIYYEFEDLRYKNRFKNREELTNFLSNYENYNNLNRNIFLAIYYLKLTIENGVS